jgi:hypothetical protein
MEITSGAANLESPRDPKGARYFNFDYLSNSQLATIGQRLTAGWAQQR